MGVETEQVRTERHTAWRKWLTGLLLLSLLGVVTVYVLGGPERATERLRTVFGMKAESSPLDALRHRQELCNERLSVPASGAQARSFSLSAGTAVEVEIVGVRDTAKGFTVYLMTPADWNQYAAGKPFEVYRDFQGRKVTTMKDTKRLPAGKYMLAVINSENIINSMEVDLRIVANPD